MLPTSCHLQSCNHNVTSEGSGLVSAVLSLSHTLVEDVHFPVKVTPDPLCVLQELDHRSARGKILSYQVTYIHGREEEDELPCCNVSLPAPATHVCVRARNSEGLGPPACTPPLCADRTFLDCNIHGDSSNRIRVLCKDPVIASPLLSFVVEWRAQREDLKMELDWTRTRVVNETLVLPGDFTPGTPYHVSVYVLYSNSCITGFSTEVYSREEVPTASPKFTSHILSPGSVLVSWEEIPKWHKRGAITHYSIYVRSADHLQDHPGIHHPPPPHHCDYQ
ncbi:hypothetical protein GDO81_028827 [Engystomops pustulosus]|uniref:Fibronectin type-III domain-containing protein n=1 Tax=Engystomops pustulosus TaxID=76066 RepID=A0AAV6ZDG1_ENGPU|nr:hypothetical protein GDO81_028827 [Engystomops pustulosus]